MSSIIMHYMAFEDHKNTFFRPLTMLNRTQTAESSTEAVRVQRRNENGKHKWIYELFSLASHKEQVQERS